VHKSAGQPVGHVQGFPGVFSGERGLVGASEDPKHSPADGARLCGTAGDGGTGGAAFSAF